MNIRNINFIYQHHQWSGIACIYGPVSHSLHRRTILDAWYAYNQGTNEITDTSITAASLFDRGHDRWP